FERGGARRDSRYDRSDDAPWRERDRSQEHWRSDRDADRDSYRRSDRDSRRYEDRDSYRRSDRDSRRYEDRDSYRHSDRDSRHDAPGRRGEPYRRDREEGKWQSGGDRHFADRREKQGNRESGRSWNKPERGGEQVRSRDPEIPETVSAEDLSKESRNHLKSLSKESAERVARHLVYAGSIMETNPQLAYEHAQAAYRHASRIDIVREALGLAAYLNGRYAEALRELRTYRRMTDDYSHVAIEADSERGLGRPEKALSFISEIPLKKLDPEAQIELALVTSGARADMGDSAGGLSVLEKIKVENLDDELRARVELIRADRLEELGRKEEAEAIRREWEPVFDDEGEVDLLESEDDGDSEEGVSDDTADGELPNGEHAAEAGDVISDDVDPEYAAELTAYRAEHGDESGDSYDSLSHSEDNAHVGPDDDADGIPDSDPQFDAEFEADSEDATTSEEDE
ncbi:MAG: hypothetical protein LKK54_00920, partial [Ancrocorticia sp.]|nr:hypothetical protein [Ancrocorticia sp.]